MLQRRQTRSGRRTTETVKVAGASAMGSARYHIARIVLAGRTAPAAVAGAAADLVRLINLQVRTHPSLRKNPQIPAIPAISCRAMFAATTHGAADADAVAMAVE